MLWRLIYIIGVFGAFLNQPSYLVVRWRQEYSTNKHKSQNDIKISWVRNSIKSNPLHAHDHKYNLKFIKK